MSALTCTLCLIHEQSIIESTMMSAVQQQQSEFKQLVSQVRVCELCVRDLPLPPRPVFQIDENARVLIVGQAPGLRVHESGLPFNDPSGDRLRNWLGVTRVDFYDPLKFALLPMAFCFPGTGASGDLPPPKRCADTWRQRLLDQLVEIRFTLLCGRYAINWHAPGLKNLPLSEIVRDPHSLPACTLATPHPSGRNNGWFAKNPWFERDVVPTIQLRTAEALKIQK